jgi:hypothetical protein
MYLHWEQRDCCILLYVWTVITVQKFWLCCHVAWKAVIQVTYLSLQYCNMEAPLFSKPFYKNTSIYIVQSNKIIILMFKFWLLCLIPWRCIYLKNMTFLKFCEPVDTQIYAHEVTNGDGSKFTPTPALIAKMCSLLVLLSPLLHFSSCHLSPSSLSLSLSLIPFPPFLLSFFIYSLVYSYF